jgi:hypothetical protein
MMRALALLPLVVLAGCGMATAGSHTTVTQTVTSTVTVPQAPQVIKCHERAHADGAIVADPSCSPGQLEPTAVTNPKGTVCKYMYLAALGQEAAKVEEQLPQQLLRYGLPGNPSTYMMAFVVPLQDGGAPVLANAFPLQVSGFGGVQTRQLVAQELHHQICAGTTTVTAAARLMEGDWLRYGLPDIGG